ncbi:MAG: hypothetical protein IJD57_01540 [Candidatus Gastranaerophilales bacterium]|nr:hypothetical protein [Candidatus Gastranaerophilales bacterium]
MSTMNKDKYISIQELVNKYVTREIIVRGGKSFEILLSSIELDLQEKYFEQKPKIAKMRRFYDIPVYFYLYDNELFVVDKPLKTKQKKFRTQKKNLYG